MKKRILSLLMVLAMVLSLLPMNVLMISAEPAESDELPAVGSPATNHEHVYRNNYCTVCGAIDPGHQCEFGWYDILADKHGARCWLCTEVIGDWKGHTYVDGKCTDCGAEEPNHQHVMADDYIYGWPAADGHYSYCVICRERMSDRKPHTYDSDGICTVCDYIGPKHVHMFEEGHVSMSADGHWQYCTICNQSEYADHRYKDGACEICGYMDPDHPHVADEWWHGDARGHYHECEYVTCGMPVGGIIPHTYKNYRCTACGYVDPDHPHDTDEIRYEKNYHYHTCSVCGERMDGGEEHNYVDGYCTACGRWEDDWGHTCNAYGELQSCEFGHYYVCSECWNQSTPMESHDYEDGRCTVCGYVDPYHTCVPEDWYIEQDYWSNDDDGHYRYCKICSRRMDVEEHTYGDDGCCIVCGYAGPSHVHVNSGECHMSDEKGHYYDCATCNARPFLEPHNYVNGRCEVCGAVDPSHTCVAGERWTYDWDSRYMGHYQTCAICYDRVGEVQHHIYEHGRCIVCELAAPNHVHNYVYYFANYITERKHTSFCSICGDGDDTYQDHTFAEDGICTACGYSPKQITALTIRTGENKEIILTPTYEDGTTCDMTVIYMEKNWHGGGSDGKWSGLSVNVYTDKGILSLSVNWHIDGRFYVGQWNAVKEKSIQSNILDSCEWFTVYNAVRNENIVNPVCTFDGDVWVVTGTAYDGESVRMTMDGNGNVLPNVPDECMHPKWTASTTLPTCIENGRTTYTCASCSTTITNAEPAIGHSFKNGVCERCGLREPIASGVCGENGDNLIWTLDDEGTLIISGVGQMNEWDRIYDMPWYHYRSQIENVTINAGVTSIDDYVFYGCNSLQNVTIPNSVTSIGNLAFHNCSSLQDVYYSGTETQWNAISVGSNNSSLLDATIHYNHVHQYIQDTVVAPTCTEEGYTEHLCIYGEVERDNYVPAFGHSYIDGICARCGRREPIASGTCGANGDNLTWTLDDEGTLTISGTGKMKDYSVRRGERDRDEPAPWYGYRTQIKKVFIPSGVTNIGGFAFFDCTSLIEAKIPDSVVNIGDEAFSYCTQMKNVTIPNRVTSIGKYAFESCESLEDVIIPDSVTNIGSYAFFGCSSLSSVAIPSSVTSISSYAFYWCDSLQDVYYGGTETQWNAIYIGYNNQSLRDATIHYNHIHQFIQDTVVAPTCAEPGYTEHLCGYGETVRDSFLPALGHVHADDDSGVVTAPTCAEQGYTTYICKRCGESYQGDFVDTVPHDYEAVVTAPTCTEQGYTTYICKYCTDSYTSDYTDATGHHIVADEAVEATCITDGHTIGSHCDRCRQVFIMPTVLPATGKHVSTGEHCATATHRAICDVCGQEYGELLPITCDLNGDDKTDADDLAILLRHVAKIEVITDEDLLLRLDLDGNGAVNAADVTILAQRLAE